MGFAIDAHGDLGRRTLAIGNVFDRPAEESLTIGRGRNELDLRELAHETPKIREGSERPVEPGRAHFEAVGVVEAVDEVERTRGIARKLRTIVDRDTEARGT